MYFFFCFILWGCDSHQQSFSVSAARTSSSHCDQDGYSAAVIFSVEKSLLGFSGYTMLTCGVLEALEERLVFLEENYKGEDVGFIDLIGGMGKKISISLLLCLEGCLFVF